MHSGMSLRQSFHADEEWEIGADQHSQVAQNATQLVKLQRSAVVLVILRSSKGQHDQQNVYVRIGIRGLGQGMPLLVLCTLQAVLKIC